MGLFKRKKEADSKEIEARENNKVLLDKFVMKKALGVKKYPDAMQFIYDDQNRWFAVAQGPAESFKEKEPWVIEYDQVEDVWLEVDEYWTETGEKYAQRGMGTLLQEDFKKVYWRYDFYMNIKTSHPYAKKIRYQMNYKTAVLKIPGFSLFVHRGLDLSGKYKPAKIEAEIDRLKQFAVECDKAIKRGKVVDVLIGDKPDNFFERIVKGVVDNYYISRIDKICKTMKRAEVISEVLNK